MFTFKRGPARPRRKPGRPPEAHLPETQADAVIRAEVARQMAPPGRWLIPSDFLSGTTAAACPEAIDVTGRARYLVYGPYVALAPGRWRATVILHLCPDAARRPLAVQFGAEPNYTTLDLPFGVPGNHRVDIEHAFDHGDAAQVRLWLKRAAFHGEARLIGVSLGPAEVPAAVPPARTTSVGDDHV
jgi:hypothetical protein